MHYKFRSSVIYTRSLHCKILTMQNNRLSIQSLNNFKGISNNNIICRISLIFLKLKMVMPKMRGSLNTISNFVGNTYLPFK